MITYQLTFNLQDPRVMDSPMEFVSGDVGAYGVEISFLDNGKTFDISKYTFSIKAVRADEVVQTDAGVITDNRAKYTFKNSMYSVPGDLCIEFALTDASGNYITAKIVRASVIKGAGKGNSAEDNTNVYVTLLAQMTERLNRAQDLLDKLNIDLSELYKRPTYGGTITEIPEDDAPAGTYYIAGQDMANNGISYGGFVWELFELDGGGLSTAYNVKFSPDNRCISPASGYYPSEGRLAVYSTEGVFVGYIDLNPTLETMPMYLDLSRLGVTSEYDYVEFFLAFYNKSTGFPHELTILDAGTLLVKRDTVSGLQAYITQSKFDAAIGDVDAAVDAILAMDEKMLGGDA